MRTACLSLTLTVTLVFATACGSKQSTANTPPNPTMTGTMMAPSPPLPGGGGAHGRGTGYPPGGGMTPPEIQLLAATPIPGPAPMMGDPQGTAGHVVLGPGSSCVKLALVPVPVQATWVIKAVSGGGAGQAYSK